MPVFPRSDPSSRSEGGGIAWRVLVVDHDPERSGALAADIAGAFPGVTVESAMPADSSIERASRAHLALVAVAVEGPAAETALAFIGKCRGRGPVLLAHTRGLEGWTMAQKCRPLIAGAARVLDAVAPDFRETLRSAVATTLRTLGTRFAEEQHLRGRLRALGLVGEGPQMLDLFRKVLRLGPLSDLPVLVTGETGTGKERVAQALHQSDPKRGRAPLIAVNCAALAPNLAESELFGHRRGAFTGAERARPGLVRAADGGVLFLDEIGELDLTLQSKLLRVLQEGRVLGVGEESEIVVDVRVVAATNRDLKAMVAAGRFRADLYHRIGVLSIELPPLRGRTADIVALARHFLEKYCALHRSARHQPSADFLEALGRLPLPGNVRQLENLIRQALVHKTDETPLALSDLPVDALWELAAVEAVVTPAAVVAPSPRPVEDLNAVIRIAEENGWNLNRCVRACEREVLAAALRRADGNQTKAATLLGVTSRSIYNKVRKLGLHT